MFNLTPHLQKIKQTVKKAERAAVTSFNSLILAFERLLFITRRNFNVFLFGVNIPEQRHTYLHRNAYRVSRGSKQNRQVMKHTLIRRSLVFCYGKMKR